MTGGASGRAGHGEEFRRYAASGDRHLRDQLVEAHLDLARHLAWRFVNRGEAFDDLFQVASLALVKAVDRYDPDQGVAFTTFGTRTIVGELKRHFRDRGWAVRAPRRLQELYVNLNSAIGALSQELGRSPTIGELAAHTGAGEEEVIEALEAGRGYRAVSLEAPTADGDGEPLGERLGTEDVGYSDAERRLDLSPLVERLPPRQQLILELRFVDGLTQSEIARKIGISQMHVSRLLQRSLATLRESVPPDSVGAAPLGDDSDDDVVGPGNQG
jgi:RNA polymerase sigma-B factor